MGPLLLEVVQQLDNLTLIVQLGLVLLVLELIVENVFGVDPVHIVPLFPDLIENLYFVESSFLVVLSTLLHLQCHCTLRH